MKTFIIAFTMILVGYASQLYAQESTFCKSIDKYIGLAPTSFEGIKGPLDAVESKQLGEEVFNTTEILEGFTIGRIAPRMIGTKKELSFWATFKEQAKADALLAKVKSELDACLKGREGFFIGEFNGQHSYDGPDIHFVLQIHKSFDKVLIYKVALKITG